MVRRHTWPQALSQGRQDKYLKVMGNVKARPNPSLKRSANGRPPGPGRWYAVHFHRSGPGVLPLSPA
ncbi:hypothetical protein RA210_U460007 [Rubrivivax sp. A210]|nr:hypothetical protein RA210_U460007 [Rubrivivax sp. A210]